MEADPRDSQLQPATLLPALGAGLELIAARRLADLDDVHDAVQETLSRTLMAVRDGRIPPGVSVGAYAHGIAVHVIADIWRARIVGSDHASSSCDSLADPQPCALTSLVNAEERAAVHAALEQLPSDDRELLDACFVRGESVAAMAERLGVPPERLRKRKSRAISRLRELLGVSESVERCA